MKSLSEKVPKYCGIKLQVSPDVARYHALQLGVIPDCTGEGSVETVEGSGRADP
jgi:hypothetical protein